MASRPRRRPTIAASGALRLVELGAGRGLDRSHLTRLVGLAPVGPVDPEARVAIDAYLTLWAHLGRALDDPSLPLRVASQTRIEDLNVMGYAILASRSGREAMERALRYQTLFDDSGRFEFATRGDEVDVRWFRPQPLTLGVRLSNESVVGQIVHTMGVAPRDVGFRHPAPSSVEAHRAFFRCPVQFGATYDGFSFAREVLDRPRNVNPGLSAFVGKHAEASLAQTQDEGIAERVRRTVSKSIASGEPSCSATARDLGMSERTLRRRLDEEDLTFRQIVEGFRRERAQHLLREERASVTEVAFLLGFSDVSAFSRAFRRWHRMSPGQFAAGFVPPP